MTEVLRLLKQTSARQASRASAARERLPRDRPDFNPLAIVGPGENQLSAIFAWMLSTDESHGAGDRFLALFLALLRAADAEVPSVTIWAPASCEVPTRDKKGRLDILLPSANGRVCIAIENKPWAIWQPRQIRRYLADQASHREHALVVALIGYADDAGEALRQHLAASPPDRPAAGSCKAVALGYGAVADWIDACAAAAGSSRVSDFLMALAAYCRTAIVGVSSMSDPRALATDIVAAGPDVIRAAIEIANAGSALPEAIARAVVDEMRRLDPAIHAVAEKVQGKWWGPTVTIDGVTQSFALFGYPTAYSWIGVRERRQAARITFASNAENDGDWPWWEYLRKLAVTEVRELARAVEATDPIATAHAVLAVSHRLLKD